MASRTRICRTCGKEYDYCPKCARGAGKPEWMILWCSEKCKDIFNALSAYNLGDASAADLKDILTAYEVKNYEDFDPNIRKKLQKIVPAIALKRQKNVDVDLKEEEVKEEE